MNIHPSTLHTLTSGEPTAAALHREEFLATKKKPVAARKTAVDPRGSEKARILRAETVQSVGSYFS